MQVFLKQYGERRTGTNYLRYLVSANFSNAVVLMHVLGDKHSPPAPFDELWRASRDAADPALAFVSAATHAVPAETTDRYDAAQRQELERLAQPVAGAFAAGSLGFVISIKDPYAWALSFARYAGWNRRRSRARPIDPRALAGACAAFNHRYGAWLELARERPASVHFVRYEDLLADAEQVLGALQRRFDLHRSAPELVDAAGTLPPASWDHDSHDPSGDFSRMREFYLQREYLQRLSLRDREVITANIDWSLLAGFGYEPIAICNASSSAAARTSAFVPAEAMASGDDSSAQVSTALP